MRMNGHSHITASRRGGGRGGLLRPVIAVAAALLLAPALFAQGVAWSWDYVSQPFGAGRQVFSVSTFNVGTDGSVAFTLTVDDGSLNNFEYQLFWLGPDGQLRWSSGFQSTSLQTLAVRDSHLVFLDGGQSLISVAPTSPGGTTYAPTTITTFSSSDTAYTIEQGRAPGVLYVAETATDKASFAIHAYRLDSGHVVNLEQMIGGTDAGEFKVLFPSAAGELYQVERTTDLINWTPLGNPLPGTDTLLSVTDSAPPDPAYYRVRKL